MEKAQFAVTRLVDYTVPHAHSDWSEQAEMVSAMPGSDEEQLAAAIDLLAEEQTGRCLTTPYVTSELECGWTHVGCVPMHVGTWARVRGHAVLFLFCSGFPVGAQMQQVNWACVYAHVCTHVYAHVYARVNTSIHMAHICGRVSIQMCVEVSMQQVMQARADGMARHRTTPHHIAPHRTAPHDTRPARPRPAWHRTAPHRTAPH